MGKAARVSDENQLSVLVALFIPSLYLVTRELQAAEVLTFKVELHSIRQESSWQPQARDRGRKISEDNSMARNGGEARGGGGRRDRGTDPRRRSVSFDVRREMLTCQLSSSSSSSLMAGGPKQNRYSAASAPRSRDGRTVSICQTTKREDTQYSWRNLTSGTRQ